MTKLIKYFTIFFLFACLPAGAQGVRYTISPINADTVLDADSLRTAVEALCAESMGGRATGTEGGRMAAAWIEEQFRSIGLEPVGGAWLHGFSTSAGMGRNVMGLIPGNAAEPRYIVLMAHYDNLGYLGGTFYPGADSNASGVAALLQTARMVKKMNECRKIYSASLIVVALDAKEKNQAGAERLYSELSSYNIQLVVNLDQLGSGSSPITKGNPRYLMMLSDATTGRRSALEQANEKAGTGLELGYDYYGSKDFTNLFFRRIGDQRVFLENGIPAVMFTSGITLLNNKPGDVPSSLDYSLLKDRVRLIFRYLDQIM